MKVFEQIAERLLSGLRMHTITYLFQFSEALRLAFRLLIDRDEKLGSMAAEGSRFLIMLHALFQRVDSPLSEQSTLRYPRH